MTAKQQVLELLEEERRGKTSAEMAARRDEWQEALQELFLRLSNWLKDAVDQGLLVVTEEPFVLSEEKLGPPLTVQRFKVVTPAGIKFTITPKARFVTGADGRVDLERAGQRFRLARKAPGLWQFRELGEKPEDLTEEAFWNRIHRLIS
jgi:hypothetical protein